MGPGARGVDSAALGSGAAEASLFELPGFDAGGCSGVRLRAHAPGHVLGRVTGTAAPAPAGAGQHALRMTGPARAANRYAAAAGRSAGPSTFSVVLT